MPAIARPYFGNYGSRFNVGAFHHAYRLMPCWIESVAQALEWHYALHLKNAVEPPMNGNESSGDPFGHVRQVFKRAIEIVQYFEQLENKLSFSRVGCAGTFPLYAAAIVIQIGQRSQVELVLAAQLCSEPLNFSFFGAHRAAAGWRDSLQIWIAVCHNASI
jgi:hypothetical protein